MASPTLSQAGIHLESDQTATLPGSEFHHSLIVTGPDFLRHVILVAGNVAETASLIALLRVEEALEGPWHVVRTDTSVSKCSVLSSGIDPARSEVNRLLVNTDSFGCIYFCWSLRF